MKTRKKRSSKISAYGLLSSAFVAAGVHQAEGQIEYVDPVDMPIEVSASFNNGTSQTTVSSFKLIDLDVQNTINPITVFQNDLSGYTYPSGAIQFGIWAGGSRDGDLSSVIELDNFAGSAAVNNAGFLGNVSSIEDIASLPLDAVVNTAPLGNNLRLGAGGIENAAAGPGTYWSGGDFAENFGQMSSQTGYIGVTFDLDGAQHNGWIQLTVELNTEITGNNSASSITKLTIHDFAYNTIPDEPILIGQTTALPVELISFIARPTTHQIVLKWRTASELNHAYFELERSSDGRNFEALHRIQGSGDVNVSKDYSYTDAQPLNGNNFYRLKQVDLDGTITYSKILYENITQDSKYNFSPNPFQDKITIQFPDKDHNGLFISLTDISGKSVFRHFEPDPATRYYDLNTGDLPGGVYFLQIIDNDQIIKEKLIKR